MYENPKDRAGLQIDMTPDGQFRAPPSSPVSNRILRAAILVAALAAVGVIAALALWIALALIPIAIGAALIAYGLIRYRMWKAGISGRGFGVRPGFTFRR